LGTLHKIQPLEPLQINPQLRWQQLQHHPNACQPQGAQPSATLKSHPHTNTPNQIPWASKLARRWKPQVCLLPGGIRWHATPTSTDRIGCRPSSGPFKITDGSSHFQAAFLSVALWERRRCTAPLPAAHVLWRAPGHASRMLQGAPERSCCAEHPTAPPLFPDALFVLLKRGMSGHATGPPGVLRPSPGEFQASNDSI